ncbi:MAG: cupin domain-containing protein [Hyphomicrobiaceae bacterium]
MFKEIIAIVGAAIIGIGAFISSALSEDAVPSAKQFGFFNKDDVQKTLPKKHNKTMFENRLVDDPSAGVRVVRIYGPVRPHLHKKSDTHLYVLSGRAIVHLKGDKPREVKAGDTMFWRRDVIHSIPRILEHPFDMMTFDSPRRSPTDVVATDGGGNPLTMEVN